ncbi:MAG: 50S ribosomal protein L2 [Planctomycetota bacterium]
MALKQYKPVTPGRRLASELDFSTLTKKKPEKNLTKRLKVWAGRNNYGHITIRHRWGGAKRKYRIIDFKRDKVNMYAQVIAIEYDPNRNVFIALVKYEDGEKRYILCPENLKVGDKVISGEKVELNNGNCMPLKNIPAGTLIHNVELIPGRGGIIARSAGTFATAMGIEGKYAIVQLPSGEVRKINCECKATVGRLGNEEYMHIRLGKAGRRFWLGFRPSVRGLAMNPDSHPHGGGEGSKGSLPRTPWGKPAKGGKTRNSRKVSSRFIVKRRPPGPRKFTV